MSLPLPLTLSMTACPRFYLEEKHRDYSPIKLQNISHLPPLFNPVPSMWFILPTYSTLLCPIRRYLSLGLGFNQLIKDDLISKSSTQLHLQRPFLQIKSHFQASGAIAWTYFRKNTAQPTKTHFLSQRKR